MKKIYLTFLMIIPLLLFSQGENDNWYFGNNAAVNFSGSTPTALTNSQMVAAEGCGTVSDNNGNLLFYTNGENVWNREHQIMSNGFGLLGRVYDRQLVIVKDPTNVNKYYIFTTATDNVLAQRYIAYSIVDMSQGPLSGGIALGMVTDKNIPIQDNNNQIFHSEAITAVSHNDGTSYWILIPNGSNLYAYLLNSQGLSITPVVSNLVYPVSTDSSIKVSQRIDISQNFSNYLSITCNCASNGILNWIYSFNNSTGTLTNDYLLNITSTGLTYSSEFNKTAEILYFGDNGGSNSNARVFAIDLVNSQTSVIFNQIYSQSNLMTGEIQRNKYNDIYMSFITMNGSMGYLSKIINPDVYGGSFVDVNNIYLAGKQGSLGLPQLIPNFQSTNYCVPDYLLTTPETNISHTYLASNTIKANTNYTVGATQDIKMKAGNYILLEPNTKIEGEFLAKIENCSVGSSAKNFKKNFEKPIRLSLDLRTRTTINENDAISLVPNPASDFLTIVSTSKIEKIYVSDFTGKKINVILSDNKIDVRSLPSGVYLIDIQTSKGNSTQKFIKK